MALAIAILLSSAVTILVSLLLRNLASGEAKIEHRIPPSSGWRTASSPAASAISSGRPSSPAIG